MARASSPAQNLGGRGNLKKEGGALNFWKLAAWKLPLPVTACGTEVKRNTTQMRGEKKNQNQRQEGRGLAHSDALRGQKKGRSVK